MFGLHSQNEHMRYGVLIDISSGSIGVAIVESNDTEKIPTLVFAHRIMMRSRNDDQTPAERMRQMREALFSASLTLSRDGLSALTARDKHARVMHILISCASPWSYTISKDVQYQNDDEIKITPTLIKELTEIAEQEIEAHIASSPDIPQELGFEIVERTTVGVRINDYPIHNPLGLKGTSISLAHITGLIPLEVMKTVSEVREKILPNTEVRSHTLMLILFCLIRDLFPDRSSFCIIAVTSEATEFGIVQDNTLTDTMHIAYGSGSLYRDIMEKTGKTEADITSLILSHADKTLKESAHSEVDTFFTHYTKALSKSFINFMSTKSVPQSVILITEPFMNDMYVREFKKILSDSPLAQVNVESISPETLNEITFTRTPDAYLSLLSRFFHKLHTLDKIDSKE